MVETSILGASLGVLAFRKEVLEYVERLVKEKFEKEKILYTVEEAAEKLNIKVSRLRQAVFRREISHVKIGALVRFKEEDLENFIDRNSRSSERG